MPLRAPTDVEATADGNVWIADTGHDRVVYVDGDGFTRIEGDLRAPVAVTALASGRVAYALDQAGVVRIDLDEGGSQRVLTLSGGAGLAVDEFTGVGYVSHGRGISLFDLGGGGQRPLVDDQLREPAGLSLSPDRRRLYAVDAAGALCFFDLQQRSVAVLVDGLERPRGVCITPAGLAVADARAGRVAGVNPRHASTTVLWQRGLRAPAGVSFDRTSKTLLIADTGNDRIARVARDMASATTMRLLPQD